jgi:hypothetical protein
MFRNFWGGSGFGFSETGFRAQTCHFSLAASRFFFIKMKWHKKAACYRAACMKDL